MTAVRRILACTDLSPHAREALGRAAQLAGQLGAQLGLLHVVAAAGAGERAATDALDALAVELESAAGGRPAARIETGEAIDRILAAAHDAQLLAIGATSRGALRRFVAGTTADRLVERSLRPVLVVKQPARNPYRHVLVAADFSPNAAAALELALAVAPDAELTVVHVIEAAPLDALRAGSSATTVLAGERDRLPGRAQQAAQRLDALLAQAASGGARRPVAALERGEPAAAVLARAAQLGADLVVAGRHGRPAADSLLVGSVTRTLLRETDCDVLVGTGATRVGFDADALPPTYP